MSNLVAQNQQLSPLQRFNRTITSDGMQNYIQQVLGEKKASFTNNLVALVGSAPLLQNCEPMSVIYAAMKATALDLPFDPNLGMAYVIPYNSKNGAVAQFQIGKAGLIQLALRSSQVLKLNAGPVYECDEIEEDVLSGDITLVASKDADRKKKPIKGFFAYLKLINGFEKVIYMSKEDMDAHGKRFSKSFTTGPWSSDYQAMAEKTMIKKILKWAPLCVEAAEAAKFDQAAIREDGTPDYVDAYSPDEQQQMAEEQQAEAVNAQKEAMKAEGKKSVEMP